MAIVVEGVEVEDLNGSGSNPVRSVTVPSGTTAAYLLVAGWDWGFTISAAELDGNPYDAQFLDDGGGDNFGCFMFEWRNPAIGTQNLDLTINTSSSHDFGGWLLYVSGGVLTGWRDADALITGESGSPGANDLVINTAADDVVFALDGTYGGAPPEPDNQSGWTSLGNSNVMGSAMRLRSVVAAGSTVTVERLGPSYPYLCAFSLEPAGGGGGATSLPLFRRMARMSSHFR